MAILLRNTQLSYRVNLLRLQSAAHFLRNAAGVGEYEWSIWLTNNRTIRDLNIEYRDKHQSTDVLSIAPQRVTPGQLPPLVMDRRKLLGECIISVEYVHAHGGELGQSLVEKLERLLAHSLCHLLGYDHESDDEFAIMDAKERELLHAWRQHRANLAKPKTRASKERKKEAPS